MNRCDVCIANSQREPQARSNAEFEPGRGSHNGATILHPNTKVLVNQGLFVFLRVKTPPFSPLYLFPDLLDLNWQFYANILILYSFCDIILKTKKCNDYIENLRYNRAFKKALEAIFFGIVCYDISNV